MRFKYIRIISLLLAVLILFTGCNAIFDTSGDKGQFTIRAFKLDAKDKSGDSLLLKSPDGKTMLIDAGLPECSSQLVGYLKKLNIGKLDYVVATHRHVDHIGGMPTVLDTFKADTVYTTDMPYNTEINKKFNEAITRNGCKNVYLKRGDTFDFGSDIKVEVLNPEPDIVIPKNFVPEDNAYFLNDRSIVLKMTYGQKTFLFCGDLYKSREVELVNLYGDKLNADFLKVPHHGAATSSSQLFVDSVTPDIAVMTTNIFQDKSTYDRYRKKNCQVYITGIDGNILIKSDGKTITESSDMKRKNNNLK